MKLRSEFVKLSPEERLHGMNIPVIAITGGIATGKSTVSDLLRQKGLAVIDADQLVKSLYTSSETIAFISVNFPDVISENKINFPLLRERVFHDSKTREELEQYLYQRLPAEFHRQFQKLGSPSVVLYDVPLLFEKKLAPKVDLKVVVYAPRSTQLSRLMKRDGSSEELAQKILDNQMPIEEKRKLADHVITNDSGPDNLTTQIEDFIRKYFV